MKTINLLIGLVLSIMLVASVFAVRTGREGRILDATVQYGEIDLDSTTTIEGYLLAPDGTTITIDRTTGADIETEGIVFTNEAGSEGIYYSDGTTLVKLESEEAALSILDKQYTLSHTESSTAAIRNAELTTGAYVLSATGESMSTETDDSVFFSLTVFPDDGSRILIKQGADFTRKNLPFTFGFNAMSGRVTTLSEETRGEIETSTAERAGSEGALPEEDVAAIGSGAGCVDNDITSEKPKETASHVSVVRADGSSMVVTDFCVAGDDSIVYEASCADGEARVTQEDCDVDMSCRGGACRGSEAITKFCIDGDRSPRSSETSATPSYKEKMEKEVTTTSNTIGFYASIEGGKEFGAWNDYCADEKTLIEYYCSGSIETLGVFREIICPNGCNEGKCEEPPYCHDSDGGQYENAKGKLRVINAAGELSVSEDVCKDTATVNEYYCDKQDTVNGFAFVEKACGEGRMCLNGKCTSATAITVCNMCDALNLFNIWVGTSCNADGTAATATLERCPALTYCEPSKNKCIVEPALTTDTSVITSLNKRKQWALLLDDASAWYEQVFGPAAGAATPATTIAKAPLSTIAISSYRTRLDSLAGLFREMGESGPTSVGDAPTAGLDIPDVAEAGTLAGSEIAENPILNLRR